MIGYSLKMKSVLNIDITTLDKAADTPAVTELVREVWHIGMNARREKLYGKTLGRPWRDQIEASVREYLQSEGVQTLKALVDNEFAGFLCYRIERETGLGEIGYNAVHPNFTGRGIGSKLLQAAITQLREQDIQHVEVTTGLDDGHAPARRLYEKAGFKPIHSSIRYTLTLD